MPKKLTDITIIGAGLAGVVLSIALIKKGIQATVFEKRSKSDYSGMGIQITPNGTSVLAQLGLDQAMREIGYKIDHVSVRDGPANREIFRVNVKKYREEGNLGYFTFDRGQLLQILIKHAEQLGVTFRFNETVHEYFEEDSFFGMTLSDGTSTAPQVIVGADGVASNLSNLFNPSQAAFQPRYAALRAITPKDAISGYDLQNHVQLIYTTHGHLVSYPINQGKFINFVAVVPHSNGMSSQFDVPHKSLNNSKIAQEIVTAATKKKIYELFEGQIRPVWSKGNICLIGDALHPMLPFLAQGGSMAIEDGWTMALALLSHATTEEAFASFKILRRQRLNQVIRSSNLQGFINRPQNRLYRSIRSGLLQFADVVAPNVIASNYEKIFNYRCPSNLN